MPLWETFGNALRRFLFLPFGAGGGGPLAPHGQRQGTPCKKHHRTPGVHSAESDTLGQTLQCKPWPPVGTATAAECGKTTARESGEAGVRLREEGREKRGKRVGRNAERQREGGG